MSHTKLAYTLSASERASLVIALLTLGTFPYSRVFGCLGSAADDGQPTPFNHSTNHILSVSITVIIDALTRAYNDGNDIITLSLGGPGGWTEDVSSVVASRIADKGRIVTIAAGNGKSLLVSDIV